MEETKLRGWMQSSQSPDEVANKVKGIILMLSAGFIFAGAQFFHVTLTANDMVSLATEIGTTAGAVWTIYGCVLHLVTYLGTVKTQ